MARGARWPTSAALVPGPIADLAYRIVARNRYRIFGRHDHCMVPPTNWRERFLDQ